MGEIPYKKTKNLVSNPSLMETVDVWIVHVYCVWKNVRQNLGRAGNVWLFQNPGIAKIGFIPPPNPSTLVDFAIKSA